MTADTSALSANEVFVTGEQAVVTAVTPTSLTFTIPAAAVSGSVVARSNKGADGGRTILTVATSGLFNASSVAVDAAHIPFVADLGTGATSDKVFTFDPATGTRTQVGAVAEPIGLATDSATPNFVYYGPATADAANEGVIRRTNSSGADAPFGRCGDTQTVPVQNCWVWGVGVDPDLTDYGPQGRVYVADRNHNDVKIVRPTGAIGLPFIFFASPGQLQSSPRGVVVDRNATSPFYHDVFVSMSNAVKRYSSAVPGDLEKTYDSTNSPISTPGQMAITPSAAANAGGERLLVADRGQNRIVMINPATDKAKIIALPLNTPRGIAVDQDAFGRRFAYVAEPTRVVKFPVYKTVYVVPWIAEGAPAVGPERVRRQIERASRSFETCGIEIRIRDDKVNYFQAGQLLNLQVTDWTQNSCTDPTLVRSNDEVALLDLTSRRSAEPTDINIYFVSSFTGPAGNLLIAETVTADCFSDVDDLANSGIIVSMAQLNLAPSDSIRTLAHEIGHALLDRFSWLSGDEHEDPGGAVYVLPNIMTPAAHRDMARFDNAQCGNVNLDLTTQVFRGDP